MQWRYRGPLESRRYHLWLWPASKNDSSIVTNRRVQDDSIVPAVLYGAVLPDTGHWELVDPSTIKAMIDPMYPQILVLSSPIDLRHGAHTDTRKQYLVLLWGTGSNARDGRMRVDGGGDGYWINEVQNTGFRGTYDPWGILLSDTGYFCATRWPKKQGR